MKLTMCVTVLVTALCSAADEPALPEVPTWSYWQEALSQVCCCPRRPVEQMSHALTCL
jgi:hypothetical protein